MGLTAGFGAAAYLAAELGGSAGSYLAVAAMIAFIVTLVAGMHEVDDGLKVKSLTADAVILAGVHRAFAEAVAACGRVNMDFTRHPFRYSDIWPLPQHPAFSISSWSK